MNKKRLLIVDGHNLLYRGYYTTSNMTNKQGLATNAVRGLISILMSDFRKAKATHCVVVFEGKGDNWRHDLYPEYKATRNETPDDLRHQIQMSIDLLKAMGIRVYNKNGIEGDDLIASFALQGVKYGYDVVIDSNDKDFACLVSRERGIGQLWPKTDNVAYDEEVKERFGVWPEQMRDYLTLLGDTVDNIPGAPGIGPKLAAQYLEQFQSISGIYKNLDKLTAKKKAVFVDNKQALRLSYKLIGLRTYPIDFFHKRVSWNGWLPSRLEAICDNLDFKAAKKSIFSFMDHIDSIRKKFAETA